MSSCTCASKSSCHRCHNVGDDLLERGNCTGHCYWSESTKSQVEAFPEIPQALTRDLPPRNSDSASITGGRRQSTAQQLSDSTESCHGAGGNALALPESRRGYIKLIPRTRCASLRPFPLCSALARTPLAAARPVDEQRGGSTKHT